MNERDYLDLSNNVRKIAILLKDGYYTAEALKQAEKMLGLT